ncbi:MAG: 3-methyl-2-oxobutanoate hydroxymethyltransferase [Spartobacteria bacterium]|nr:3-methyl-2-oxobutanoate hydroxymethyltransferase [Spartobacteria bacterium]
MSTQKKWTATRIKDLKNKQKIACLTAVDYASGRLLDEAGIPLILVGDSLAMTVLGYETTLPVTQAEMLHHTAAVARGVTWGLVVADMPFLSYQVSVEQAVENAGRFLKEGGANAVKIEGGAFRKQTIETLIQNGIPVMGHIGLTPQSINSMGGYKVQGKTPPEAEQLLRDAHALAEAGVFSLVLECVPMELAAQITADIPVPTIGIGAGPHCDGQVLVMHDLLGMFSGFQPKFVKRYAEIGQQMREAFSAYREDVEQGRYPTEEQSY